MPDILHDRVFWGNAVGFYTAPFQAQRSRLHLLETEPAVTGGRFPMNPESRNVLVTAASGEGCQ